MCGVAEPVAGSLLLSWSVCTSSRVRIQCVLRHSELSFSSATAATICARSSLVRIKAFNFRLFSNQPIWIYSKFFFLQVVVETPSVACVHKRQKKKKKHKKSFAQLSDEILHLVSDQPECRWVYACFYTCKLLADQRRFFTPAAVSPCSVFGGTKNGKQTGEALRFTARVLNVH